MAAKKALCIHDMSCVGRSSLTAVSPVLSVKGIQCIPLPTTVLSSHYGGFGEVSKSELTDFCFESLSQFRRIGVNFDCVYAGYIANETQVELVKQAFENNPQSLKVCDPVMGDNGRIYSSITDKIMDGFKNLCSFSDIITPNTTEACILLGKDMTQTVFSRQQVCQLAVDLRQKYNCAVVITGAKTDDGAVICCGVEKDGINTFVVECNYIPVHFPGTGDLFCATMIAYLMNGKTLTESVNKSARFVEICVKNTYTDNSVDTRYGVEIEENLKHLME